MNKQYEARRIRLGEHLVAPLKGAKQQQIDKQWQQYQKRLNLAPATTSFLDADDQSRLRVSQSAAQCRSLDRYAGAMLLRHWKTRTARRKVIRSKTRSQCRWRSSGEMWLHFRLSHTSRTTARWLHGVDWKDLVHQRGWRTPVVRTWQHQRRYKWRKNAADWSSNASDLSWWIAAERRASSLMCPSVCEFTDRDAAYRFPGVVVRN